MSNAEKNNKNYQGRKREVRNNSYRPFVQIDAELVGLLTPHEFKLYAQVMKRAGSPDGQCWESVEHMAIETKMSVATIKRTSRSLLSKNLVKKTKRPGTTALYTLTPPSEWIFSIDEPKNMDLYKLPNIAHTEPNIAHTEPNIAHTEPNIAHTEPNIAHTELQIRSPEIYSKELDPERSGNARARNFSGSKSFEPENPETATDRRQDSDLEPLCKAKPIQNPEPETADRDCPSQPIGTQPQTFRNSEQNLSYRAEATKNQSPAISNLEETNIPPAAAGNLPQEAAPTPTEVPKSIAPNSSALTSRFSHEADYHNNPVIQEAIDTYNNFRGCWGICDDLAPTARQLLLQIYSRQMGDPQTKKIRFLALIRDAVLWMNKNDYYSGRKSHKGNYHNGKNFRFLIGDHFSLDRMADFACEWRSLDESAKVGMVIQISQQKPVKEYVNLQGETIRMSAAWSMWWAISKKAKAGEEITQKEKEWANYYFPKYDIYVGAAELDD